MSTDVPPTATTPTTLPAHRDLLRVAGAAELTAGAPIVTSGLVGLTIDMSATDRAAVILAVPFQPCPC